MKLPSPCFAAVLFFGLATAHAHPPAVPADAPTGSPATSWCEQDPQRCAQHKARLEAKCAENPQRCEERRQRMEARRAQCAADPEACKAERRQRQTQHRARLQQACMDQPDGRACQRLQRLDRKLDAAAPSA